MDWSFSGGDSYDEANTSQIDKLMQFYALKSQTSCQYAKELKEEIIREKFGNTLALYKDSEEG